MDQQATKMRYTYLGKTGLKISRISFGNWLNSDDKEQTQRMTELVKQAWSLGINFFDTAEVYGNGQAEEQFAVALKNLNVDRDQYVLSTKIFWGPTRENCVTDVGLSRKHVLEGIKNSLNRLQQKYVDIVFAHRFDNYTPLEETCRAFDQVVRSGYAFYWGTSEWTASQIFEAMLICQKFNLIPPVADQCQYNMIARDKVEVDFARLFDHYGYGTTVWSPLAGGFLTGKYNDGIPEDSRLQNKLFENLPFIKAQKDKLPEMQGKLQKLAAIAARLEITQAQLAMAWVLANNDVSTAITGATKKSQLVDIVKSLDAIEKITPEINAEVNEILGSQPAAPQDARGNEKQSTFGPGKPRR